MELDDYQICSPQPTIIQRRGMSFRIKVQCLVMSVSWVIWGLRKILLLVHQVAHALCNPLQSNSWTPGFIAIKICHRPNHLWGANSAKSSHLKYRKWGMGGTVFHGTWRKMAAKGTGIEDHCHPERGSYNVEWIRVITVGPWLEKPQLWIIMCKH